MIPNNIHKVEKPFMCRIGQFVEGQRHLCCGVKVAVLQGKPFHYVRIGKAVYEINCQDALLKASETNSFFSGNVAIVPVTLVGRRLPDELNDPKMPEKVAETKPVAVEPEQITLMDLPSKNQYRREK